MKIKFYMIKIFSAVMLLSIILTFNVKAYSNKENYPDFKNYAESFMKKFNSNCKLNNSIVLYSFQGDKQALFFSSNSSGYIIINLSNRKVIEFSPKKNNKFILDRDKKYFYNGPLAYFEEDNNEIIDCKTKQRIGLLKDLKKVYYQNMPNKDSIKSFKSNLGSDNETYTLKNKLPHYEYNPDGRCVITAATMLLAYYAKYWNAYNDYVSVDNLTHECNFSDELLYYVTGVTRLENNKGIYIGSLLDGIKKYLIECQHASNIMNFTFISYFNINDYRSLITRVIKEDKPIILGLSAMKPYCTKLGHAVTAWGYCNINSNEFFMIDDGWGNDFTYADPTYVDSIFF
ncbi:MULTISPECIES: C39 family peptidase [Clostridium]|uniref:C39 family peptidase n=1 Tax=Clostridium TaxID=1485 RepID=UPI00082670DA|nr:MULTISPECIES: C39 family peptidase [Clostridium]PJI10090.1 hypothetical protein CUB90_20430 [Clostridium sp. CT7]